MTDNLEFINTHILGLLIFFIVYLIIFFMRFFWTCLGYNLGTKAIGMIKGTSAVIGKATTVLGCTVISGLIASYVSICIQTEIVVNEAKTVDIQMDFFDSEFSKIVPIN